MWKHYCTVLLNCEWSPGRDYSQDPEVAKLARQICGVIVGLGVYVLVRNIGGRVELQQRRIFFVCVVIFII